MVLVNNAEGHVEYTFKNSSSKESTHRASYNTAGWISADW